MTIAPPSLQMPLLSVAPVFNCTENATARNAYGMAAQEIVCAALNLRPIPINGNYDCCFDAEKDGMFYEIKSVRRGAKVVIYDWRLKKEELSSLPITYVLLIHRIKSARRDIAETMLTAGVQVACIPLSAVSQIARECPLRKMERSYGKRNGYTREGYRDGYYNVSVNYLTRHRTEYNLDFEFYGQWWSAALLQ